MNEFVITFRETLEATIIVGIFYTLFSKINDNKALKTLWTAVAFSINASILFAFILKGLKEQLNNSVYEKLFESLLMYLASGFLLYMIFWMHKKINIKAEFIKKANLSLKKLNYTSIFFLIFFAITREGFETALFLIGGISALKFSYLGFFTGIILAIAIGYLIFIRGNKIKLKPFFDISSIILIFFAAGMIAYGTHEMEEFLVKTKTIESKNIARVWDVLKPTEIQPENLSMYTYNTSKEKYYHVIHDKGSIGVFLRGFFGYNSNPNFIEFTVWLFTLLTSFIMINMKRLKSWL